MMSQIICPSTFVQFEDHRFMYPVEEGISTWDARVQKKIHMYLSHSPLSTSLRWTCVYKTSLSETPFTPVAGMKGVYLFDGVQRGDQMFQIRKSFF